METQPKSRPFAPGGYAVRRSSLLWASPTPGPDHAPISAKPYMAVSGYSPVWPGLPEPALPAPVAQAQVSEAEGFLDSSFRACRPLSPRTVRRVRLLVSSPSVAGFPIIREGRHLSVGVTRPNRVRLRYGPHVCLILADLTEPLQPIGLLRRLDSWLPDVRAILRPTSFQVGR